MISSPSDGFYLWSVGMSGFYLVMGLWKPLQHVFQLICDFYRLNMNGNEMGYDKWFYVGLAVWVTCGMTSCVIDTVFHTGHSLTISFLGETMNEECYDHLGYDYTGGRHCTS